MHPAVTKRGLHLLCFHAYFVLQSYWGGFETCAISIRRSPISSPFATRLPPARRFAVMARKPSPPPAVLRPSPPSSQFFRSAVPTGIPSPFFTPSRWAALVVGPLSRHQWRPPPHRA